MSQGRSGRVAEHVDGRCCAFPLVILSCPRKISRGLGTQIFEFYTNSVLHKKDLIYLHSVQTLRKQFACFAQTCDLHNMVNK